MGNTGHTEFVLSSFTDIAPATAYSQEEMEQPLNPSHTVKLFPEISVKISLILFKLLVRKQDRKYNGFLPINITVFCAFLINKQIQLK